MTKCGEMSCNYWHNSICLQIQINVNKQKIYHGLPWWLRELDTASFYLLPYMLSHLYKRDNLGYNSETGKSYFGRGCDVISEVSAQPSTLGSSHP